MKLQPIPIKDEHKCPLKVAKPTGPSEVVDATSQNQPLPRPVCTKRNTYIGQYSFAEFNLFFYKKTYTICMQDISKSQPLILHQNQQIIELVMCS